MEILVTETAKFSESCCRDLEITWCIQGNNTEQLNSSVALVTYQAWFSVFCSGQVSVLKVSTSQSNTKNAIKNIIEVEERKRKTKLVSLGYMIAKTLQRHNKNLYIHLNSVQEKMRIIHFNEEYRIEDEMKKSCIDWF